jgi:hypothetical protein
MSSIISDVFSPSEVDYLLNSPEALAAKERLGSSNVVKFTIPVTDAVRSAIQERLHLDLTHVTTIPMRWIKGDTAPHIDTGASAFERTHLVYLNDSPGSFVLDTTSYPITANTAFVFNEGLTHKTLDTGLEPRLLLGPMNELAEPVGRNLPPGYADVITYYANQADADASGSLGASIGNSNSYTVGSGTGNSAVTGSGGPQTTIWAISTSSYGASSSTINLNGSDLSGYDGHTGAYDAAYLLYPVNIVYYTTLANLINNVYFVTNPHDYTVGTYSGISTWIIDASSTGITTGVITSGSGLNAAGTYLLYSANAPCFREGTKILCKIEGVESFERIETLRPGTLVKTSQDGYKKIELIGSGPLHNPGTSERIEKRLYKCSPDKYPGLIEDLYLTGCHSILVNELTDKQREETIQHLGHVFVTDKKYRLMACVDERAEPWNSEGNYTIYHLALENENKDMNYGIYANGLLVETCCINRLKNKTNFTLL